MFLFKLNRIHIINNYTWSPFYVYDVTNAKIMSIVTDGDIPMGEIDTWKNETNQSSKDEILKNIVVSTRKVITFPSVFHVRDHDTIPFGDSGYLIYQNENIPEYLNWLLCVIKGNEDLRADWAEIHKLITSEKLEKLSTNIAPLVTGPMAPGFLISAEIAHFTASLISEYLSNKRDVQLGLLCQSLNRAEHYKYGDRKQNGVQDLTRNMTVDYSLFSYNEK